MPSNAEVVHPGPDRGGEHDRQPEEDQPEAVALVVGVQFPRVAAEAADDAADQPRHQEPGHRDRAQQPRGEHDEQVVRRRALAARRCAAPARRALVPDGRCPPACRGRLRAAAAARLAAGLARARAAALAAPPCRSPWRCRCRWPTAGRAAARPAPPRPVPPARVPPAPRRAPLPRPRAAGRRRRQDHVGRLVVVVVAADGARPPAPRA